MISIFKKYKLRSRILIKIGIFFLGILFALFLLEITLRFGCFMYTLVQKYEVKHAIPREGVFRILCLGESMTAAGGKASYPAQLEEILNNRIKGIQFIVINGGAFRTNSTYIVSNLESNINQFRPHMVITMMGINDRCTAYYRDIPDSESFFFKHMKSYAFLRTLGMNIGDKVINKFIGHQRNKKIKFYYSKTNFKDKKKNKFREDSLKSIIAKNPKDDVSIVALAWLYGEQFDFDKAEKLSKRALAINPNNYLALLGLGLCYKDQGRYVEAKKTLISVCKINHKDDFAFMKLGELYQEISKPAAAELSFKRAFALNPKNYDAAVGLAWCYVERKQYDSAEALLKRVIRDDPQNALALFGLGRCYIEQKKYTFAEDSFKKAIAILPGADWLYTELGVSYLEQHKLNLACVMFQKVLELNPDNDDACAALGTSNMVDKHQSAEQYFKKANRLRRDYYNPITRRNYLKVKQILEAKGIRLVCMQYPLRSIEPLRKLFFGQENILFADNEKIFKEVIAKHGYEEYFFDMFAGDFGHCTPKGNRLLAEHIVDCIVEGYFKK